MDQGFTLGEQITATLDNGMAATLVNRNCAISVTASDDPSRATVGGSNFSCTTIFRDERMRLLYLAGSGPDLPEVSLPRSPISSGHWMCLTWESERKVWTQGELRGLVDGMLDLGPAASPIPRGSPVLVDGAVAGMVFSLDGRKRTDPIAIPSDEIGRFLDRAFHELIDQQLTPSSRTAIGHANALRRQSGQDRIHMEHLIAGLWMKEEGSTRRVFGTHGIKTPQDLLSVFSEAVQSRISLEGLELSSEPITWQSFSSHTREALWAARNMEGRQSQRIQSRQLLYGALEIVHCAVIQGILKRGIRKEEIDLEAPSSKPNQSTAPSPSGQPAVPTPPPQGPVPWIAGYQSDRPGGVDLLSITDEVDALCRLLAYRDVSPPVSLGLFGDWGTGKTFFMDKMYDWFRAKRTQSDLYCSNIVCIKFNAWHFIDKDLWASLTAEVFEQLGQEIVDRDLPTGQAKRETLEAQLAVAEQTKKDVEARLSKHEQETAKIEESIVGGAIARNALQATLQENRADLDKAAEALQLPKLEAASDAFKNQLLEWKGVWGFFRAFWTAMQNSGPRRWFLWGALGIILAYALLVLVYIPSFQARLGEAVTRVIAILSGIAAVAAPFLNAARKAMAAISNVQRANDQFLLRKREEVNAESERLRQELAAAEQEVQKIAVNLDTLKPNRQISDFVRQRRESTDYTQHLGVVARSRRDFSHLSTLLEQVAKAPADREQLKLPAVDRIVLFIDDLDRCPEKTVVDVLQAVHLLLAFPLFVVVVGVDSRWLLHSLRQQSSAFQDKTPDASWQSTPMNYLEKIFQIPFALRPRGVDGFGLMIDALSAGESKSAKAASHMSPPAPSSAPAAKSTSGGNPAPSNVGPTPVPSATPPASGTSPTPGPQPPATPPPAPPPPPPEPRPEPLTLETWERECMKAFSAFIPTPRATKRFVNVYRLIRAMVPLADRDAFIGAGANSGEYRAVLLLLALLTGYPEQSGPLVQALRSHRDPKQDWWKFADGFDLAKKVDAKALAGVKKYVPDGTSCDPFVGWAPTVARFSFHSGRPAE